MFARANHRNSGFQSSRPLDYIYDREWTLPPDVFAQDASKAVRALSTIVVRPDFRTMFSNRARHSVSIIPDRAAPYGMRAYRRLQWMKIASHPSQVDVTGKDSHRFRVRCCLRAVTNMQEAEAHISSAATSSWRAAQRSPTTPKRLRRAKDHPKNVVVAESDPPVSEEDKEDKDFKRLNSERVRMVDDEDQDETVDFVLPDKPSEASMVTGTTTTSGRRGTLKAESRRIRGLSPSEETLIMLSRHERHLVREAWEAALPKLDQNQADWDRRIALELELEKDKWNLRSKEIEAINRARSLTEERDRKRRAALMEDFHTFRLTIYYQNRAKTLENRLRSFRRNHQRGIYMKAETILRFGSLKWMCAAMRRLQGEWCGIEKKRPKTDPVLFLVDPSYDGFAPQKRFGELAKRWHEYLPNRGQFFDDPEVVEQLENCVVENWKPSKFELAPAPKEREFQELCVYLTKWTPAKLKTLHSDLKEIRKRSNRARCRFKPREWSQQTEDWEHVISADFRPHFVPLQLQEEWVQQVVSTLPPTLDTYNMMDLNVNLMKMRGHNGKSGDNAERLPTPGPASSKASKTMLEERAFMSRGTARPGKKRSTPRRRPLNEKNIFEEEEMGRFIARVRPRHPQQGSQTALHSEESAERPGTFWTAQESHSTRIETIQESLTNISPVVDSVAAVPSYVAARPSAESIVPEDLRRNLSERSTFEIRGRSSSHVGFRSGPWACRSPPNDCPGTPASIDTVTAISRFTGDDLADRRFDEEELPGSFRPSQSAHFNVSASASEETHSTDDTHIITDDVTELVAAAFRAKVREQGNTLAAQRIDEAPSPTDSCNSAIAIPILGRSVSQQRAPAALPYSASEEHTRMVATNSETTITTDTSESSWTLNEAQRICINRYIHDKNRTREVQVHVKAIGVSKAKGNNANNIELNEEDD